MQLRDGCVHRVIDRGALGRVRARHLRLPEHAPVGKAHDVERRAGDGLVGAIKDRLGDGKALCGKRADDAEFAVDRMRRGQQFARRLAPQHVTARRRFQQISRVRLPALELLDGQRPGKAGDVLREIICEPRRVERERGGHLLGAGKGLLPVDRRHAPTFACRTRPARRRRSCSFAISASPCRPRSRI